MCGKSIFLQHATFSVQLGDSLEGRLPTICPASLQEAHVVMCHHITSDLWKLYELMISEMSSYKTAILGSCKLMDVASLIKSVHLALFSFPGHI